MERQGRRARMSARGCGCRLERPATGRRGVTSHRRCPAGPLEALTHARAWRFELANRNSAGRGSSPQAAGSPGQPGVNYEPALTIGPRPRQSPQRAAWVRPTFGWTTAAGATASPRPAPELLSGWAGAGRGWTPGYRVYAVPAWRSRDSATACGSAGAKKEPRRKSSTPGHPPLRSSASAARMS
jgi:hypothetical protein